MKNLHPLSAFFVSLPIIILTAVIQNPYFTVISFIFSVCFCFMIKGKATFKSFGIILPVCAFAAIINALFSNRGDTKIAELPNGNFITTEAVIYSLFASAMVISLSMWFIALCDIFTSDKVVYLFSGFAPTIGLLISMTLRAIPEFARNIKEAATAQKFLGNDVYSGKIKSRLKAAVRVISAAISMSIDNAAQAALSMKNRGYGSMARRVSYNRYSFSKRDFAVIILSIICTLAIILLNALNNNNYEFYPKFYCEFNTLFFVEAIIFALICAMPSVLCCTEFKIKGDSRNGI